MRVTVIVLYFAVCLSSFAFGQKRYDNRENNAEIFKIVEEMPKCNMTPGAMADLLNRSVSLSDYELNGATRIIVSCIVNCQGQGLDYKLVRPVHPELDALIVDELSSRLEWTAGRQGGREVDVAFVVVFEIKDGKFAIIQDPSGKRPRQSKQ